MARKYIDQLEPIHANVLIVSKSALFIEVHLSARVNLMELAGVFHEDVSFLSFQRVQNRLGLLCVFL